MENLAPNIYRQRMIIEGYADFVISDEHISDYLKKLSNELAMTTLIDPVTHRSKAFGWAGWIHWETSGAHFYTWDKPVPFFSVDIYTCKEFSSEKALAFTKDFFKAEKIVFKNV